MEQFHFSSAAHLLIRAASQRGVAPDELLCAAGVQACDLPPAGGRMRWGTLRKLTESALRLTKDPALGLLAGANVQLDDLGIAGLYQWNLPTVGAALQFGIREVAPHLSTMAKLSLEHEGGLTKISISTLPPADAPFDPHVHLILLSHVAMLRKVILGADAPLIEVRLKATHLGDPEALRRIAGIPVRLGQPENCIVARIELLGRAVPMAHPRVRELAKPGYEAFMRDLKGDRVITLSVRAEMESQLRDGDSPNLNAIADRLRIAARTLRARLQGEGTNFREQLDDVRRNLTFRELSVPGVKFCAVAAQVGFRDPATFTRAFRRWTGASPTEWQDQRNGGGVLPWPRSAPTVDRNSYSAPRVDTDERSQRTSSGARQHRPALAS